MSLGPSSHCEKLVAWLIRHRAAVVVVALGLGVASARGLGTS